MGAVIRQERENAGLSQRALARKAGRTETSLSKIEAGNQRVDLVELLDIARALRIELSEVIRKFEEQLQ